MKSICIFCGSADAVHADYIAGARFMGKTLAEKGIRLIYGGGKFVAAGGLFSTNATVAVSTNGIDWTTDRPERYDGQTYHVSTGPTSTNADVNSRFRGTSLDPEPPKASKHPEVRYLDIHEDDELDEDQLRSWIRQASELPGERM